MMLGASAQDADCGERQPTILRALKKVDIHCPSRKEHFNG